MRVIVGKVAERRAVALMKNDIFACFSSSTLNVFQVFGAFGNY
jgi:hypothetical protein